MEEDNQMTDEEAILQLASKMKDNIPTQDDKANVHTFLQKVAESKENTKTGYLITDKNIDEIGNPQYHMRGLHEMIRISKLIMNNPFFEEYFKHEAQDVLATSLSREGFLIKQATTQTKQVADATKRRVVNKGWFGKEKVQEQGGDINSSRWA